MVERGLTIQVGRDRVLLDGEEVLAVCRYHWVSLVLPGVIALAVTAVAGTIGYLAGPDTAGDVIDVVFGSFALIALLRFAWRAADVWAARILVTDRRVIVGRGVIVRRVQSVGVREAATLTYRRGVMGRVLGYGDFSAGHGTALLDLRRVATPDRFYRSVHEAASGLAPLALPEDDEDTGPIPRVRSNGYRNEPSGVEEP